MNLAKYCIFEGIDGSGKSSLARAVRDELERQGTPVRLIAFPSRESAVGALIRDVFEKKAQVSPEAMMFLFVAEAADMEARIHDWMDDGINVLCDRHAAISGLVYQTALHYEADVGAVTEAGHFREPDRIYVLDVPPEVALARREGRKEARNDLYEPADIEKVEAQRRKYFSVAKKLRTGRNLTGLSPIEALVKHVIADMTEY